MIESILISCPSPFGYNFLWHFKSNKDKKKTILPDFYSILDILRFGILIVIRYYWSAYEYKALFFIKDFEYMR